MTHTPPHRRRRLKVSLKNRRRGRRHDDRPPTTSQKVAFGTVAGASLIGFVAFLYQMVHILEDHSDWAFIHQPPGYAEVFRAAFFAAIAFGGALFSDFRQLIRVFYKGESK